MPKVKTNSGASKRFKVTGNGKVRMKHAFKNHILTKKSKKRKRSLGNAGYVDKTDMNNIRFLLKI